MRPAILRFFQNSIIFISIALSGVVTYYVAGVMLARNATPGLVQKHLASDAIHLTASDLTGRQKEILIAVEDPDFLNHKGLDFSTSGAGLTTISQSVVKKLYFKEFKPGLLKIRQSLIARFALDAKTSKADQLTLFINSLYFGKHEGQPVYGIGEAAKCYFKKEVMQLSEEDYIAIIAMIIAPTTFHIHHHPEANHDRVRAIKRYLSGAYQPKSLMDVYYGGKRFRHTKKGLARVIDRRIWGY